MLMHHPVLSPVYQPEPSQDLADMRLGNLLTCHCSLLPDGMQFAVGAVGPASLAGNATQLSALISHLTLAHGQYSSPE
jgi:hypothetical protein